MEIELKVGGCAHTGGFFRYSHFIDGSEGGEIFISNPLCGNCNDRKQIDIDEYITILNHEYSELLSAKIAYDDGIRRWNGKGFNDLYWKTLNGGQ